MVEKLTVFFFIILCLLLGTYLILAPWDMLFGNWSDNFFLALIADKSGMPAIQRTVASNWFRGAVTGLGVTNLVIATWEIFNFNSSVAMLSGQQADGGK
ncbi:MAG: hypothetical protein ACRD6X_13480 [Pyrinomonadaceae bacterium]